MGLHIFKRFSAPVAGLYLITLLSACGVPATAEQTTIPPQNLPVQQEPAVAPTLTAVLPATTLLAPTTTLSVGATAPSITQNTVITLPIVQVGSNGFLTNKTELQQRKQLADQGIEPYQSAVAQLLDATKDALNTKPKARGNLLIPKDNDVSEAEVVDASQGTYILALAYQLTGDTRYAEHARALIMAWVTTNKTISPDGNTPLIISNNIPAMVWGADLLADYPGWTDSDRATFKSWLVDVVLPSASDRENNWGDWGILLRLSITRYVGDEQGFATAVARWKKQVDGIDGVGGIAADGHLPEETRREDSGITYTSFALNAKVAAAFIAQRADVDLWNYTNPQGGNLKKALNFIAPYVLDPTGWPYYKGDAKTSIHPVWEIAYQHWQEPIYAQIITQRRPYGYKDISVSWTTLTNGVPLAHS